LPTPDPWLSRQNEALKLRGLSVPLELCGSRLRLRASMPPRAKDGPGGPGGNNTSPLAWSAQPGPTRQSSSQSPLGARWNETGRG